MKALIDLDHSEKWRDAIKFPSRKSECSMFLPGNQIFFWKKSNTQSNLKGKQARLTERWYGPGTVIGHEWDGEAKRDSYWVSYGGKCFLVAGTHMRHAEFEECLSQEKFVDDLKQTFEKVQLPTFEYVDVRRDQMPEEEVNEEPRCEGTGLLARLARLSTRDGMPFIQTSHAPGAGEASSSQETPGSSSRPMIERRRPEFQEPEVELQPAEPTGRPQSFGPPAESNPVNLAKKKKTPRINSPVTPCEKSLGQTVLQLRGANHVLIVDEDSNDCYFLKWKTFNKLQRKGRELDPRYFDAEEKKAFQKSDAKEWQSFLDTGAVIVISPDDAAYVPKERIFTRSFRYVRTNKAETETDPLQAKSRIVVPGDVDPDGDIPLEEGGFRTDAPTCPQIAFHLLMSMAVTKKRRIGSFDCKTAFLTGKGHDREIYCRPPKEGLPGVAPGSLLKIVKGAYGLREAPRLWYLRAKEILLEAGFEELQTAKACFCLYEYSHDGTRKNVGMLVLHVDDAAYAGEGPLWEKALQHLRKKFTIGKEEFDEFTFLGRHVKQNKDFSIEIDQHEYVKSLKHVRVDRARRSQGKSPLTSKELHDYRSLVGQLAWPARESMPQICYAVSDLQQKVAEATVGDLVHANNVLNQAKRQVNENQKLRFLQLGDTCGIQIQHSDTTRRHHKRQQHTVTTKLGMAAVHDASFMGQPREGSQSAYCLMLCSTQLFEGKARTHLLDWGSSKIHRKMRSTLACEAASAAKAFDKGAFARVMLHEIENGRNGKWDQLNQDDCDLKTDWTKMCRDIPFCLGTDCKSLYDVCMKSGSMPEERRVALDLMDVRESIEQMGDQIRWIPTDHMLVDCMTKNMPADVMLKYLQTTEYAFKYDDVIKHTKREVAKARKAIREGKKVQNEEQIKDLPQEEETYDEYEAQDVNLITNYEVYRPMFSLLYPQPKQERLLTYSGDYRELVREKGFQKAYETVVLALCH